MTDKYSWDSRWYLFVTVRISGVYHLFAMKTPKHILRKVFNVVLIVAAYGFLAYILYNFDGYPALFAHFRSVGIAEWCCLVAAVLLIPVNILCEAWKWRYLLKDIAPMGIAEAQRQVYLGFVGAFLTPERLGDYPTRVTRISDKSVWLPAITLGFIGTMALSTVNITGGTLSLLLSGINITGVSRRTTFIVACCLLLFFIVCIFLLPLLAKWIINRRKAKGHKIENANGERTITALLCALAQFSPSEFPILVWMSLCRYIVYATQLLLVLIFCGVSLAPSQYAVVIPVHYLFVSITPTVAAADAAVRGSVGAAVFSYFTPNTAGVVIAAVVLWLLNSMIPMFIGSFMQKKSE